MSLAWHFARLPTFARRSALVGALALAACVIAGIVDHAAFFQAWLVTWLFLLGITLASMMDVMIHELTGGRWARPVRRPLEAAMASVPLVALLAIPLAFGLGDLFPWTHATGQDVPRWWLNVPGFLIRNAVWLLLWSALAWRMRMLLARGDAPEVLLARRHTAILGLIVYLLTITLAAYDWVASLAPGWASTAVGIRLGASQFIAAFGFAVPFAVAEARDLAQEPRARARELQDLGNLLLTFAMTWAYFAFSQYLIIWAEDLPKETAWYLPRTATSWRYLVLVVIALNFALPTVAMLFRGLKRRPAWLAAVCGLALLGQWLDAVWLTLPSLRPHGFFISPVDLLALLALAAIWLVGVIALLPKPRQMPDVVPGAQA